MMASKSAFDQCTSDTRNIQNIRIQTCRFKIHNAPQVNPKQLSQMDWRDEEGFVIKFWLTPEDRYAQPITKFTICFNSKNLLIERCSQLLPILRQILEYCKFTRDNQAKIHHFDAPAIPAKMDAVRQAYIVSLWNIADDYGGKTW
jgi:hypothetical protein